MERLEQELRVVRDDVQNLWKSIHMLCIQKICPKILRDHLAVQASSIDFLEKQRLTIKKFQQVNVHGPGATSMDVDALAKTKGGKKGGKEKDKGGKSKKFEGNCFWCGAYGHMMEDCQKNVAGKPQVPKSPRGPDPKSKGKGKGGKGKKGASSLDEWPDGQKSAQSNEQVIEEVAGHWCCQSTRDVQPTRLASLGKNPETGTRSLEILKSGNSVPMLSTLNWERESI